MAFHEIDLNTFPRREHVRYFSALAYPYVGVTQRVELTSFLPKLRMRGYPFFLSFLWCAAKAANAVPELRQRLRGDRLLEYDVCRTSHTVAKEDGTYCYCTLSCDMPLESFLPYAAEQQRLALADATIEESAEEAEELLFVSSMPWLDYQSLVQPVPMPADSNPRISWGRFTAHDGKTDMPVTLLCNHALVDGRHLAQFYAELDRALLEFASESGRI